ncbi:hypothetical protein [Methylobacterium sp. J-090]|nr:hypothetical protein [Methylobacterium sp. J-090]MCJ2079879.1 hypothetical protein [Methylobacterium sp. J-090]
MYWFAHGLGLDDAPLREIIENVFVEMLEASPDERIAEIRRRLRKAAGVN